MGRMAVRFAAILFGTAVAIAVGSWHGSFAQSAAAPTALTGARVIDPSSRTDRAADLFIDAGRIVAIGAPPHGFAAQRSIDASGCWVLPGLVDLAARLREPGFEYRATLESEMRAALAGGITSLVCPPDTEPVLDEPGPERRQVDPA